jgi:hypothetical protein
LVSNHNEVVENIKEERMVYSKAYTLSRLISEVRNVSRSDASNANSLVYALSPRKGFKSAKVAKMNEFLDGKLSAILNSSTLGATPRQRLLNALKARKKA